MLLARVAIPVPLGRAFTYSVPEGMTLTRGARVLCDFGKRRVLGVVLEVSDREPDVPLDKLKPVRSLVDSEPVLPEELLGFLIELGRYYLAPIGEVMRLALPAVERGAEKNIDGVKRAKTVGRMLQVARVTGVALPPEVRGQARALHEHLTLAGATEVRDLQKRWKNARAQIARLEEKGLVATEEREEERDPFRAIEVERDVPPTLTPAQADAVAAISAKLDARERQSFLLHGVTGSGKTEVYLRTVGRVLESGGGAIVLVPEIALTPQLVSRFRARLGERIAVLHSGLGDAERHAMWKSLRSGNVRIAIGARSALFAPVEDLRLVCVDEEHDGSFKQEEGVRYNARDMALLRAHRARAVCLLGSATPSLSSELATREGRMQKLVLPERARSAALPSVEMVDLRRTGSMPGGHRLLSVRLHRALEKTLAAGEQAILFLNRRGFAPSLLCEECGVIAQCPNCAVALTLHRTRRATLVCHYCDYHTQQTERCAACKSDRLLEEGAGTERIEAILKESFPMARIARLDRDVASGQKSDAILTRMRERKLDILVGTQMVTKGHDLPAVTLVGVLNADAALSLPDFRAAERTFHLLVQVAGRAGRGDAPGHVLIQTWQPEHFAIRLAARHAVDEFVELELADRKELGYPPFQRIALVRVDAVEDARARAAALELATLVKKHAPPGVEIIGPAPAPLPRLRNRFRHRFLVRSGDRALLRQALLVAARAPQDRRIRMAIDIDPMSML